MRHTLSAESQPVNQKVTITNNIAIILNLGLDVSHKQNTPHGGGGSESTSPNLFHYKTGAAPLRHYGKQHMEAIGVPGGCLEKEGSTGRNAWGGGQTMVWSRDVPSNPAMVSSACLRRRLVRRAMVLRIL